MAHRRSGSILPVCAAFLALLAVLATASVAAAQTATVQPNSLVRKLGFRSQDMQPTWINYNDCAKDDELTFQVVLSGAVGYSLEVWVGAGNDCTTYESRFGSAPTCWQVYSTGPQTTTQEVKLRAQDIIAQNKSNDASNGPGSGTATDCDEAGGGAAGQAITLYFMLVDGTGQPVGTGSTYATQYDLIGPPAPTNVEAGVGENILVVEWSASNANDLIGYRLYCDPKPGTASPASQPMAGGAAGMSGAAGTTASGGTDGGVTDAGATDGAVGTGGTGGASGDAAVDGAAGTGGGAGGNPNCPSTALVVGEQPDSEYQCGSVTSKTDTSASAKGLVNGVNYAVAVAAVDQVGNSGPLSSVACGTPELVDDFFELYSRAGGKGGGGFCALGREPSTGVALLLLGLAGALGLRRWRRGA